MIENHIYQGNCLDVIRTFPNESINCVITSPPYWQLRDYGWNGQWGLEPTFEMYLENLWSLMDEIYRVLTNDGTVWINLGDTYAGKSKDSGLGQKRVTGKNDKTMLSQRRNTGKTIEKEKCLLLIPHRFAIGCIERGWIVRNDIIWAKRNGMPESVTDRFSKKHEYIFFMTKSTKYYFDLDSIRDKHQTVSLERYKYDFTGQEGGTSNNFKGRKFNKHVGVNKSGNKTTEGNIKGKNPGTVSDFWDITTKASSKEHYAAYNEELINKPIVAGCPEKGIILDPFCGTATTGVRAIELNRKFIGIEGSEEYVKIANNELDVFRNQRTIFQDMDDYYKEKE